MKFLSIRVPRKNEYTYEQAQAVFAGLISGKSNGVFGKFLGKQSIVYSLNIISLEQKIHFVMGSTDENLTHLKNQLMSQYGKGDIVELGSFNPLEKFGAEQANFGEIQLSTKNYLPLKTIDEFNEIDPLASVLSAMSRSPDPNSFFRKF